jgi:phage-related minor tail protein
MAQMSGQILTTGRNDDKSVASSVSQQLTIDAMQAICRKFIGRLAAKSRCRFIRH